MLDPKVVFETFKKQFGLSDWQKLSVEILAGDASSRQYYRLSSIEEKLTTWVLQIAEKFDSAYPDKNPFISGQKIFQLCGVRVPRILGSDSNKGWILLEDLGDETLQLRKNKKLYVFICETPLF